MADDTPKLRKLAEAWSEATRHDMMGMGSATAGSERALRNARADFAGALLQANPKDVADALLYEPENWCIFKLEESKGWWRPDKRGYSRLAAEAGRYTAVEVLWILASSKAGDNLPVHHTQAKDDTYPGSMFR